MVEFVKNIPPLQQGQRSLTDTPLPPLGPLIRRRGESVKCSKFMAQGEIHGRSLAEGLSEGQHSAGRGLQLILVGKKSSGPWGLSQVAHSAFAERPFLGIRWVGGDLAGNWLIRSLMSPSSPG